MFKLTCKFQNSIQIISKILVTHDVDLLLVQHTLGDSRALYGRQQLLKAHGIMNNAFILVHFYFVVRQLTKAVHMMLTSNIENVGHFVLTS